MTRHRNVLLVGGGGYVGVELQRLLAESNYHVRVLDTFWYPNGKWDNSDGEFVSQIEYLEQTQVVTIKIPSIPNDKHLL